jgi:hypothetical protein
LAEAGRLPVSRRNARTDSDLMSAGDSEVKSAIPI